jgi:hypothetical protein
MAHSGHGAMADLSPLSGIKQTPQLERARSIFRRIANALLMPRPLTSVFTGKNFAMTQDSSGSVGFKIIVIEKRR